MRYRIVCVDRVPMHRPTKHAHIVEVGTGATPLGSERFWTVPQLIAAISRGDAFYAAFRSDEEVVLAIAECPACGRFVPRLHTGWADHHLDEVPECAHEPV